MGREKRMRFEPQQRKEECEFQLRMFSLVFGGPSSHSFPLPGHACNAYEQFDDYNN